MGTIHKFKGDWEQIFKWDGARTRKYNNEVSETWMIGKKEGAENFAFRYYEIQSGGVSNKEHHHHDHGVLILQGEGKVQMGEEFYPIARGDILHIPPDVLHQLSNTGQEPLGFLCVIPARREKEGKIVWAEEGINFD